MKATILNDQGLKRYFILRYMDTCIGMCVYVCVCVCVCVRERWGWGGVTWRGGERDRERETARRNRNGNASCHYVHIPKSPPLWNYITAVDTK